MKTFRRDPRSSLLIIVLMIVGGTLLPWAAPWTAPWTAAPALAAPRQVPGPDANPFPAGEPLGVDAGILIDASNGKVLWSENDTEPRAPASLTKLATAMVVLQRANLNATATVTPEAAAVGGSELEAPAGTVMTIEDMLWGLLMVSGNDMAVALAQAVSPDGTQAGFVQLMNADAAAAGATGSNFVNPHGLDAPGHASTARDLALLTMVDMKNPLFAKMVGTVDHTLDWDGTPHELVNHNKLLTMYPGTIGIKTGYTDDAGWALDSEVTRGGTTLMAVVLGTKSPAGYDDSEALYNWGFANLATLEAQSTDRIVPKPLPAYTAPAPAAVAASDDRRLADASWGARHPFPLNAALLVLLAASLAAAGSLTTARRVRRARASR
ncbi:MAG: D-alanyl-D-alanine carboxypeptidase family protein [Actinomycetota bacterium]